MVFLPFIHSHVPQPGDSLYRTSQRKDLTFSRGMGTLSPSFKKVLYFVVSSTQHGLLNSIFLVLVVVAWVSSLSNFIHINFFQ